MLNPHATLASTHSRGFSLPQSEWTSYPDHLKPFEAVGVKAGRPFEGTAIRLSLRTADQARQSRIKQDLVTVEDVQDLLDQYLTLELEVVLLYLRHVRKITFKVNESDGSTRLLGEAQIQNAAGLGEQRNVTGLDSSGIRKFDLTIRTTRGNQVEVKKWHMLHYVESPDSTTKMVEGTFRHPVKARLKDEKLYPHVALAMPEEPLRAGQGKLFTVLVSLCLKPLL